MFVVRFAVKTRLDSKRSTTRMRLLTIVDSVLFISSRKNIDDGLLSNCSRTKIDDRLLSFSNNQPNITSIQSHCRVESFISKVKNKHVSLRFAKKRVPSVRYHSQNVSAKRNPGHQKTTFADLPRQVSVRGLPAGRGDSFTTTTTPGLCYQT